MYSASDSISANITDVTMRVITIIKYHFRLEQFQNVIACTPPGVLAVLHLRKGYDTKSRYPFVSTSPCCTHSCCMKGQCTVWGTYLIRIRKSHSHAKHLQCIWCTQSTSLLTQPKGRIHIPIALTLSSANMSALWSNNSFTMAAFSCLGMLRVITVIRGLRPSYAKGACEWRAFVNMSCMAIVIIPSYTPARHTLLNASSALQVFLISRRICGISV